MEDDFVTGVDAEVDYVSVLEDFLIHPGAVDEEAIVVAAIFEPVAGFAGDDGGAAAGDARVGELKMIFFRTAAADEKGDCVMGTYWRDRSGATTSRTVSERGKSSFMIFDAGEL